MKLNKNPGYEKAAKKWQELHDLYEADDATLRGGKYLWPHAIEKTSDAIAAQLRADREQRTQYMNFLEILISLWSSYFFAKPFALGPTDKKALGEFEYNVDGRGTSFFEFLREQALKDVLLYGRAIGLVDAHNIEGDSLAAEREVGARPFMRMLNPLDCPGWQVELKDPKRLGSYKFIRHEYLFFPQVESSEDEITKHYRSTEYAVRDGRYVVTKYQKKDAEALGDPDWDRIGRTEIDYDRLPIAVIDGDSWMDEVRGEVKRYHNTRSNKDNLLYTQGYQRPFIKGIKVEDADALKGFSEYVYHLLPIDGDAFTLDPIDLGPYERTLAESVDSIFKLGLNQLRSLPVDSRFNMSAEAQDAERDNARMLVTSTISDIQRFGREMIEHFAAFKGINGHKSELTLQADTSLEGWQRFMQTVAAFSDRLSKYPAAEKAIARRAVRICGFSQDEEAEALSQIDQDAGLAPARGADDPVDAILNGDQAAA